MIFISSLVRFTYDTFSSACFDSWMGTKGPINILPLRRLYIERQIQPEMLSFVSTEEVIALFNMYVLTLTLPFQL